MNRINRFIQLPVTRVLLVATLTITSLISTSPSFAASEQKIGIVDLQRAVSESKEGKAAQSEILKKTEQFNNELKGIQGDFEKLKAELEKDGSSMKDEVRAEKERQLQQKSRDFQKRQRDAQEELKQIDADLLQGMIARLSLLIGKIGEEEGYSLIIEQGAGVRFFSKKIDVTPLMIKKADEMYGK